MKKAIVTLLSLVLMVAYLPTIAFADTEDTYSQWSGTSYTDTVSTENNALTYDDAKAYVEGLSSELKDNIVVDTDAKTITLKSADAFAFITCLHGYLTALNAIDRKDNNIFDPRNSAYWISKDTVWTVKIDTDIDLLNKEWTPLVSGYVFEVDFQGHTVKNLKTVSSTKASVGLFSDIYYVKNLVLDGAEVKETTAEGQAGAVAGSLNGWAENITVKNAKVSSTKYLGGIGGYYHGKAINCQVMDSELVSTGKEAGGIAGLLYGPEVSNCTVKNTIITVPEEVGGIAGRTLNGDDTTHLISNCTLSNNTLSATKNGIAPQELEAVGEGTNNYIGSIVGRIYNEGSTTLTNNSVLQPAEEKYEDTPVFTDEQKSVVEIPETVSIPQEVKTGIKENTAVTGVQLTGFDAVIQAATQASEGLLEALDGATAIEISVAVEVTPVSYSEGTNVKFDLTPVATVTVGDVSAKVGVANSMIDQDESITVSIYTGFKPKMIVHRDGQKIIEAFQDGGFTYDETKKCCTFEISHFSTVEALNDEPVATIGSVPYPTLQDAVDAAKTNDVITLNGTCSENVKVTEAKTFTIQGTFNGTVSVDTGLKLTQNDNVYTVTSDNEDKEKTYEKIKAALVKAAKVISIFLDKQIAFVKAIKATAGFSIIRSILGYFMGR